MVPNLPLSRIQPKDPGWTGASSAVWGRASGQMGNAKALRQKKLSELKHSLGRRAQRGDPCQSGYGVENVFAMLWEAIRGFPAEGCGIRLALTVWKLNCEEGIVVERAKADRAEGTLLVAWAMGESRGDRVGKETAACSSILAGKSHGQRGMVGDSPRAHRRVGHDLATKQQRGDRDGQTGDWI